MIRSLTPAQVALLRRCSGGLRTWESGEALRALRVVLDQLCELDLVALDEPRGYVPTAQGEEFLLRFAPW